MPHKDIVTMPDHAGHCAIFGAGDLRLFHDTAKISLFSFTGYTDTHSPI
jgi:hypothetical protein